jgi:Fe-S cluster assembly ATP-binding protein
VSALLEVSGLVVEVADRRVLHGVDVTVGEGEAVAIMGPNGSGKSTLVRTIFGRPGYRRVAGMIRVAGLDVSDAPTHERARAGLALIEQDPVEVPGVLPQAVVAEGLAARGLEAQAAIALLEREAAAVALEPSLLARAYNVELSGGEKKKLETAIAAALPGVVVVGDEIDSGLDVDALRVVARRLRELREEGRGLLLVTHYPRLLAEVRPDVVLVLVAGRVAAVGSMELAERVEREGYRAYGVDEEPLR